MEGYCILAERLRSEEEREFIKKTLEKHCKCTLNMDSYYKDYSLL